MTPSLSLRMFRRFHFALLLPLLLFGCDGLFGPAGPDVPASGPGRVLGLVEITLSAEPAAGKVHTPTATFDLNPGPASGLQMQLHSNGSFTDGTRAGGYRYLWASFRVRNAASSGAAYPVERRNVTFLAVAADARQTPVSRLSRFDGAPADPAIEPLVLPTGHVYRDIDGRIASVGADVLQVLTEEEAAAVSKPANVNTVFPYGFVVRNPNRASDRTLPADPAPDQWDGIVTFAFKVPLQAASTLDPFIMMVHFLIVEDAVTRVTQSPEEQDAAGTLAAEARAEALGASTLTLLPGGTAYHPTADLRLACGVRTAGPAGAPLAMLFPSPGGGVSRIPDPRSVGRSLPPRMRFSVADCGGLGAPAASNFVVQGFLSGRQHPAGGYASFGGVLAQTPAGAFFPGEEVEVTLTSGLLSTPTVGRYRIRSAAASGYFTPFTGSPFTAGEGPVSVAPGDVNGDGRLDLATANAVGNSVSVLLGNGAGGFTAAPGSPFAVGIWPASVALGDVNGDGRLDLAAANVESDDVAVLLGNGAGGFTAAPGSPFPAGTEPYSVALGDVNGDGNLDLATANSESDDVSVLLGNGSGGFTAAPGSPFPAGSLPSSVALGDVNGDGRLDLAVGNGSSNSVAVLLGDGSGDFSAAPGSPFLVGVNPISVALGDVNADGRLDIAAALFNSGSLAVLLGDGSGGFSAASGTPFAAGDGTRSVVLGDVNGDGRLDLAAANYDSNSASVLLSDGAGGFSPAPGSPFALGASPFSVALGDVDGDGRLDLAAVRNTPSSLSVLKNN